MTILSNFSGLELNRTKIYWRVLISNETNLNQEESWPSQSPDLNPIEHTWSELSRVLRGRKQCIRHTENLRTELKRAWAQMSIEYV